ncbi:hypothetical protein NEFER03_0076 [Nematocida sp. LUAm3]|nr:hypothetical protein NEFER03_0076 [Nematocida sp. LUAm3]KAI5173529.1 hypothetical protein NEFER02_0045 [Nematocida sp. LUAm2]KAI5176750.1 hypothetical protein NEFER01_0075 [Nematocida sp. LUAm1]
MKELRVKLLTHHEVTHPDMHHSSLNQPLTDTRTYKVLYREDAFPPTVKHVIEQINGKYLPYLNVPRHIIYLSDAHGYIFGEWAPSAVLIDRGIVKGYLCGGCQYHTNTAPHTAPHATTNSSTNSFTAHDAAHDTAHDVAPKLVMHIPQETTKRKGLGLKDLKRSAPTTTATPTNTPTDTLTNTLTNTLNSTSNSVPISTPNSVLSGTLNGTCEEDPSKVKKRKPNPIKKITTPTNRYIL